MTRPSSSQNVNLPEAERPWPVVLLTALGAWLSALPLMVMVGLLLDEVLTKGVGPYVCGVLLLVGALTVLRSRQVPLFLEQLAVPALLVGGGTLGFGLYRDLNTGVACVVLGLVALAVAALLAQAWLRVLLGGVAAGLAVVGVTDLGARGQGQWLAWCGLHGLVACWWLAWRLIDRAPLARRHGLANGWEAIGAGWLLLTLAGLAVWSGMTFLLGGVVGLNGAGSSAPRWSGAQGDAMQITSVLLSLAAAAWAGWRWPLLRRPAMVGTLLVLSALAWWLPTLGAAWLVLVLMATSHRWRLAVAAGLSAAWIIGSFYYQLQWPLSVKALWLLGSAALLGGLAWWAHRGVAADATTDAAAHAASAQAHAPRPPQATPRQAATGPWPAAPLVLASLLATLLLVNAGIWQKERLISQGQPVFVALAPVDPRSLMQGDYMQLAFQLPPDVPELSPSLAQRPLLVLRRGADGVAQAVRVQQPGQTTLAADELRMQLSPIRGQWGLVTDAWYFREGEAARWAQARYGEFRVMPDGQALLVGLVGADRQPIR